MRLLLLVPLLLVAACAGGPRQSYVRVTSDDGRVYYSRGVTTLHSQAGGFITFRDLVTMEDVKLKNGTYRAQECPEEEIEVRQREYINDPSHKPVATDYEAEPK